MADDRPYLDVADAPEVGGFTLPARKWREILFVGAVRRDSDGLYARDPERPAPPMREPDLFPVGRRFRATLVEEPDPKRPDAKNPRRRNRGRVLLVPVPPD